MGVATAFCAIAAETAQWPPPTPVQERMHELQQVIGSRDATPAQREAAREELSGLLKSPAGQLRGATPDEKPVRPAHAPLDPLPAIVKPLAPSPAVPAPPVARVEVVPPARPVVLPSGSAVLPSDRFAVDPRTGHVLHEIPGGYVDPRTGQVTPR
ncbi:MAG: hypothetical protein ACXWHB_06005, partial [Usitatibacter sp.]